MEYGRAGGQEHLVLDGRSHHMGAGADKNPVADDAVMAAGRAHHRVFQHDDTLADVDGAVGAVVDGRGLSEMLDDHMGA